MTDENVLNHLKERAERVRFLRKLLGLSRSKFTEKFKIPPTTIQNWEDVKSGGLGESAARRLAQTLEKAGIICPIEWLLFGIGDPPLLPKNSISTSSSLNKNSRAPLEENATIFQELLHFKQLNPDTLDLIVPDKTMEPRFSQGEQIAGIIYKNENLEKLIGWDCIFELKDGSFLLRRIENFNTKGSCTLICTNQTDSQPLALIEIKDIVKVAPVIWQRRKKPL